MPDHEEAVREALLLQLRAQVGEILRSTDPELSLEGAEAELVDIACKYSDAIRASERAKYAALVEAAGKFDGFYNFIQAAEELGHTDPLTEHTCVASLMAGGASDYLWIGDFMKLRAALAALQSKEGMELSD